VLDKVENKKDVEKDTTDASKLLPINIGKSNALLSRFLYRKATTLAQLNI
jgi:hypothetical protein